MNAGKSTGRPPIQGRYTKKSIQRNREWQRLLREFARDHEADERVSSLTTVQNWELLQAGRGFLPYIPWWSMNQQRFCTTRMSAVASRSATASLRIPD